MSNDHHANCWESETIRTASQSTFLLKCEVPFYATYTRKQKLQDTGNFSLDARNNVDNMYAAKFHIYS